MPSHHLALFHPRLVRQRIDALPAGLFQKHEAMIAVWLGHLRSGALNDTKEVSLHAGFLERMFCDVLGYRTMAMAKDSKWELVAEKTVLSGGTADGAIGFFEKGKSHIVAPIELKGASQFLEHAKGRSLTPIQQGWDYANKTPESRWVIVSNYRETRLYAKSHGQAAYELFRLEELAHEKGFLRFVALLGRDALLGGASIDDSPLAQLLLGSERSEQEITAQLYSDYRDTRAHLFEELRRNHPGTPATSLLSSTQTILDRLLFVAFAEDRQLLPDNTLTKAYEYSDPYHPRPIWKNFLAVFRSIDKGNPGLGIPGYNGGLFRDLEGIEALNVSDEMCSKLKQLGDYDFHDDVSVDVLGHIFEQSITDLEQLRREANLNETHAAAQPSKRSKPSKRKVEGIFYTPPFVTSFLVRETLGRAMAEAWGRAGGDQVRNKDQRIAAWVAYQNELRHIRVLDPACGSGAFLVAAFDALAHEFERVNRALAEIRDHGQASLFDLTKTLLNENLFGIDKSGESVEISKLSLWLKTAERGRRLTYLDRNIRQANSVVSDPAVDPLAFDWGLGRLAQDILEPTPPPEEDITEIDARWREGFDVVLGNPPYVRQELLTAYKDHWSREFQVYDGTADLFVYFFERGLRQLRTGGRLGFVVSNKWLRGGYAEKLRETLARQYTIESIVDFGHAPVFPDADAFPCIITLRKQEPATDHDVGVTQYPREQLGSELLASYVETHKFSLPQRTLVESKAGWSLEPPTVQSLLKKLRRNGVPLSEFASCKPYYGVKTGCNAAFLVDQQTKERLCREDPGSAAILKKYLRGQDISRWAPAWKQRWMIFTRRGIDIEKFPAVKAHLIKYRKRLEPRPKDYQGSHRWPGRKPGTYKWYEIQDSVDYFEKFEQPKIIYQVIQFHPRYALDRSGLYTNDKGYLLPTDNTWLLAVLNSPVMWWHNWRYLVHMKDEALNPAGGKVLHIPIPRPSAEQADSVAEDVETIVRLSNAVIEVNAGIVDVLRVEWGIEKLGRALLDFSDLNSEEFVREVRKRRPKSSARLTRATLAELRQLYAAEAPTVIDTRARILTLERRIATAVHAAYRLDDTDLALIRATAPPRMPAAW